MFRKIIVAYNESPESQRALNSAILLAKSLNAELQTVTAMGDLPVYAVYAEAADPSILPNPRRRPAAGFMQNFSKR